MMKILSVLCVFVCCACRAAEGVSSSNTSTSVGNIREVPAATTNNINTQNALGKLSPALSLKDSVSSDADSSEKSANSKTDSFDNSASSQKTSPEDSMNSKMASRENSASSKKESTADDPSRAGRETTKKTTPSRPHIVMIVADDLGWNDVDWRDPTMHTPVLAQLASQGVLLNQSYVQPVCSPTRGAFMSGYYPYHLGLQHDSLRATQKAHLPDNVTTLPQHLQRLGYTTHMAGKWHLGFCNWRYTPTYRGFDSFVGFYNAVQDYYTHTGHRHGYDFRYNKDVFYSANGTYSAYIFTRYIEHVIGQHDVSKPLFVYLPYQSVHGPLQVPQFYIDKYCSHIHNATRRVHCAMVAALDEGVGNVTRALKARGILDDTLLLFTTDNGGPVHKGSNNWPLRGSKATLWEGGTRAMAFLHGHNILKNSGTTYNGMIHAVDWLPTLLEAAGGPTISGLDGVSQWQSLQQNKVPSARTEFVYNIDELKKNAALRQFKYKLLQGNPGHLNGWYPPPRVNQFDASDLLSLGDLFEDMSQYEEEDVPLVNDSDIWRDGEDKDAYQTDFTTTPDTDDSYQLFDLEADPTEHVDMKKQLPDVFKQLRSRLEGYRQSLVPANFPPHDPASYPSNFDGVWSPGWC